MSWITKNVILTILWTAAALLMLFALANLVAEGPDAFYRPGYWGVFCGFWALVLGDKWGLK